MIKAGLMEEVPDACFALHVETGKKGILAVSTGYLTAYSDGYTLTVHGKAAHSSTPEAGTDAIQEPLAHGAFHIKYWSDQRRIGGEYYCG